jgi:hypothetical protein
MKNCCFSNIKKKARENGNVFYFAKSSIAAKIIMMAYLCALILVIHCKDNRKTTSAYVPGYLTNGYWY